MNEFLLYSLSYIVLLIFGLFTLCYLVPRDYKRNGRLSALIALIQALLFFIYGGFPYLYLPGSWPTVSVSPLIHVTGLLLLFTGLALIGYGMFRLGVNRSLGRGRPHLGQSGVYSRSRNPQAIACGLYVIGFLMLWPSWYAAAWALLYFVLIHMMIRAEEEHLRRVHGQTYLDYFAKVPRYLGTTSFLLPNSLLHAALLSFFVPGLGQIYLGEAIRGGSMLFASIAIGSLQIIWLSIYSISSTQANAFWDLTLPRILQDVFAFWSSAFWLSIVGDAFHLAKQKKLQD